MAFLAKPRTRLLRFHDKFKMEREIWLVNQLMTHLLGDVVLELKAGANIRSSKEFAAVAETVAELKRCWRKAKQASHDH